MTNFIKQLDQAIGCSDIGKTLCWMCLWGCFSMRLTFEWVDQAKQIAFPNAKRLNMLLSWIKGSYSFLTTWSGTWIFSCLRTRIETSALRGSWACRLSDWNSHHQFTWFLGFWNQTGTKLPAVLVLKPLDSGWNYSIGSPMSPIANYSREPCLIQFLLHN